MHVPAQSLPTEPPSPAECGAFRRDGVVLLRGRFERAWIEYLQAAFEKALAQPGPHTQRFSGDVAGAAFVGDLDLWQRFSEFRRFALDSPAPALAAALLQSERLHFLYDQLFVKESGSEARTPWHQDQPYWAVSGRQICSLWLPLDPVAKPSSLHFVRGSHGWSAHSPRHFSDGSPYRETGLPALPDIDADPGAYDVVSFDVEPGDCIAFHAMTVHGAPGNAGSGPRRALATRYCGDDVRYAPREGEIAIPTSDPGLAAGDPLDSEHFPLAWPRC